MISLDQAYDLCEARARDHYENFPVASKVLPRRLRRPVSVIYAFARDADDFADEGDMPAQERLCRLNRYGKALEAITAGQVPDDALFVALADVIAKHKLPLVLFHDLLSAFRQDVSQKRYADHAEVMDYCRRSANPVGRLLLHLNDAATEDNLRASDDICSALQLLNFLQDMRQDATEMGRVYLPQDQLRLFGVEESQFYEGRNSEALTRLFHQEVLRARQLLLRGAPLGNRLKGRFGLEIRLIVAAGLRVSCHLADLNEDVFARPRLRRRDWLGIVNQALRRKFPGA